MFLRFPCIAFFATIASAMPAAALTINLDFLSAGERFHYRSGAAGGTNVASGDGTMVGGGTLVGAVSAAAQVWESLIQDSGTLNVSVGWAPLSGRSLAIATQTLTRDFDGPGKGGDIRFDTDYSWYADLTPFDNDEYTNATTLRFDMGGGDMITGRTFTGATGDAAGVYDMFSVALHELGHLLGSSDLGEGEFSDGRVEISEGPFEGAILPLYGSAHVSRSDTRTSQALMVSSISSGQRRLVSQVDLALISELSGFQSIDWSLGLEGESQTPMPAAIPLPASSLGLASGLAGLIFVARHRRAS